MPTPRPMPNGPSMLSTIAAGVRAAWADPPVRSMVLLTAAFNFAFTGPISVGLAFLADHRFDGGSAAFGLLFSAFGAGAVIGAVAAGSIRPRRLGAIVMAIAVALGIGLALIGLAPTLPIALGIIGVMGVLIGFINVQAIAWLQSRIPDELRGRVMSLVTLGSVGLAPVSLAIAGALVDLGAVTLTFVAAGVIIIAAAIAGVAWGVPTQMVWPEDERGAPRARSPRRIIGLPPLEPVGAGEDEVGRHQREIGRGEGDDRRREDRARHGDGGQHERHEAQADGVRQHEERSEAHARPNGLVAALGIGDDRPDRPGQHPQRHPGVERDDRHGDPDDAAELEAEHQVEAGDDGQGELRGAEGEDPPEAPSKRSNEVAHDDAALPDERGRHPHQPGGDGDHDQQRKDAEGRPRQREGRDDRAEPPHQVRGDEPHAVVIEVLQRRPQHAPQPGSRGYRPALSP